MTIGMHEVSEQEQATIISYLTKNYSGAPGMINARPDANSRLPRTLLQGAAANYVSVDFELPRDPERDPHDVTTDPRGNAWMSERNGCCIAKLDPKTFTFTEIRTARWKGKITPLERHRYRMATKSGSRTRATIAAG